LLDNRLFGHGGLLGWFN